MRPSLRCAAIGLAYSSALCFAADAPKIERLFPPGGQRGNTVECKVTGAAGDGTLQAWSQQGQLKFEFSEKNDVATVTIPEDSTAGLHWLRFFNEHGTTDLRPFLVGVIPELTEVEPNNTVAEAHRIESPTTTINGVLEKSADVDLFAFALSAATTFVASVEANGQLGSPMDAVLQLLDANGTVLSQNDDDRGMDPEIVFVVPADGIYHVRIFAFPATPNSTIKLSASAKYVYRLTATTGPFAHFSVPATVNPAIDKSVALHGPNIDAETSGAQLEESNGKIIATSKHVAVPIQVGVVEHLNLTETPDTPQQLETPSSMTGIISAPNEKDTYTLRGRKDQKLTITVAARTLNSPLDAVVTVKTDKGKSVKESDDRSREDQDAEASFKIPSDGEYTVTVSDRYGFGGDRFVYVLNCQETRPTFAATVKASHFVLANDKSLEIPIAVERTNGFSEEIEFKVQGQPNAVTADLVTSKNEGDSKKSVTLKLTVAQESQPFSGVVTIVGTGLETKLASQVTAPIQESRLTTSEIWLTVEATAAEHSDDAGKAD